MATAVTAMMRRRLTRVIAYHQAMAEDSEGDLADTHAEAAKQLQDVLDSFPVVNAIEVAMTQRSRTVH
jgi:hypothetical protein